MLRRWLGAIVVLLAASIPCTLIVAAITVLFSRWQENPYAQAAIRGAVARAVAITVKTVGPLLTQTSSAAARLRVVLIGAIAFALHAIVGLSPIEVLFARRCCRLCATERT
jgi:chromate transporter